MLITLRFSYYYPFRSRVLTQRLIDEYGTLYWALSMCQGSLFKR